jgi:flagellar protein FliS
MVTAQAHNTYKENTIFTASPEELTLMLFNGLVRFIMTAQKAIDDKDVQKAHESIVRSEDIISEFQVTLDMQYELSAGLALLYEYMHRRLVEANMQKDTEILEEILGLAKDLRDTWAQAMKIAKQQSKPGQIAK